MRDRRLPGEDRDVRPEANGRAMREDTAGTNYRNRIKAEEIWSKLAGGGTFVLDSGSQEETAALGQVLGETCRQGQVYALTGDLGTGKTVFTQGFARGLDIAGPVNSPTFTILQVYEEGRLPFYHFDVYRIADVEEMEEVGCEDCFYGEGVCLVEWAELIGEILPEECVQVTIEKAPEKGFDYRRITVRKRNGKVRL